MKKIVLMVAVVLTSLCASAQFRVISNIEQPSDSSSWGVENFTNSIGVGYQVTDAVMVGFQKNSDDYDFVARYNVFNNLYLSAQMPTKDATDNITLGVGMSIKVWNSLYVEPNYTTRDDEGSFNIGLSYKL